MIKPIHNEESVDHTEEFEENCIGFYRTCIICKGRTNILINTVDAHKWNSGELIQIVR